MSVVTIKALITPDRRLFDTLKEYQRVCQNFVRVGAGIWTADKFELHRILYHAIRKESKLPSQLVLSARDKACEMLKRFVKYGGTFPIFRGTCVRYTNREYSIKKNILSICTLNGRIKLPIKIADYYRKYDGWEHRSAELVNINGRLFLHLCVAKEVEPAIVCDNGRIVGVDLGINNLAVTSKGEFFKNSVVKQAKERLDYLRAELQSRGTKSAKRHLKKVSGRLQRLIRNENHRVSKEIITGLKAGDTVVMERLSQIRTNKGRRLNSWISGWSFYQFQQFVRYKAEQEGINVVLVSPRNTSKTCSRCGSLHTLRPEHRGFFKCCDCGYSLNADLNGAKNISTRHSMPDVEQAFVNEPIVSVTTHR